MTSLANSSVQQTTGGARGAGDNAIHNHRPVVELMRSVVMSEAKVRISLVNIRELAFWVRDFGEASSAKLQLTR